MRRQKTKGPDLPVRTFRIDCTASTINNYLNNPNQDQWQVSRIAQRHRLSVHHAKLVWDLQHYGGVAHG